PEGVEAGGFGLQQGVELVEAAGMLQVHRFQSEPPPRGVAVGVDEPGHDDGASQVDLGGRRAPLELLVEAGDAPVQDADAVGPGPGVLQGDDVGAAQDQVQVHAVAPGPVAAEAAAVEGGMVAGSMRRCSRAGTRRTVTASSARSMAAATSAVSCTSSPCPP